VYGRVKRIDLLPARVILVRVINQRVPIVVVQVQGKDRYVANVNRQVRVVRGRRVGIEDDCRVRPATAADGGNVQAEIGVLLTENGPRWQPLEIDHVRALLEWRRRWAR
jgi:hypothetical protein